MISMAEARRFKHHIKLISWQKLVELLSLLEDLEKNPGLTEPQKETKKAVEEELMYREDKKN